VDPISDMLCPQHQQRQAASSRSLLRSGKTPSKLENK
jgi:hypothetical protein